MSERFFITAAPQAGSAVLVGDEARHLVRVLRARVGDAISIFDGSGHEWPARVAVIGRDEVALEVGVALPRAPLPTRPLTIAVALPKGERQKWMVEKLTELGVARLVPLETTRGVAEATPAAVDRLARGVIEACKQCGRTTLMEIAAPRSIPALLAAAEAATIIVADPGGASLAPESSAGASGGVLALVGPEGGFTSEELATAVAAGAVRAALGPHILRVETAAIALAARLASCP